MKDSIKQSVAKGISRYTYTTVTTDEVTDEMFALVCRKYYDEHGRIPDQWAKYMRTQSTMLRYKKLLLSHGHSEEELCDLTVIELRDLCSSHEYIETSTVTPSGGVSVNRQPLSKAA